jgi:peptidyl-prolyl cis-trans isomerase SurA
MVALVTAPVVVADELSEDGEFLDGVAAIVNEGVVLKSQFRKQLELIKLQSANQNIQMPPEDILNEQVLEQLILLELQMQLAKNIGLTDQISDQYLNDSIQTIADQNGVRFEEMPALLAKDNVSYAEFRKDLREDLTIRELTGIEVYPARTHLENLKARIAAVSKAGDKLEARDASSYVSELIITCARLAPPSD